MNLEVVGLERHFGATRAVDGISFRFGGGQIYGFVGPNGAGKTTTMRILATLDEPTAGDALLDGVSIVEQPEHGRRGIGYVPDSLPAHRDLRVCDYLDFFARAYGLEGERRRRVLAGVEEFTQLGKLREKQLNTLSKGMCQRVSLARALVHDPGVLIMDEPAAGLDPRARIELRELLRALAEQGKAILISSHILSELSEICSGAVILEKGRIVHAGAIDDLLVAGSVKRRLRLRTLGETASLVRDLLEWPGIEDARCQGEREVAAELAGDEAASVDLLAELVRRGHRIAEFRTQRVDLEEVFLSVTRGEVQ